MVLLVLVERPAHAAAVSVASFVIRRGEDGSPLGQNCRLSGHGENRALASSGCWFSFLQAPFLPVFKYVSRSA